MDDQSLLEAYVRGGSGDALGQLVRRHIDLVYSAAVRQVGDAHLAEDVTQITFISLVRHARGLTGERVLSAWLLVTARNAALDAVKARSRRNRHEREAAQMAEQMRENPRDSQWEEIAPHLDAALASLGAEDRRAVTLRYFEGCSAEQVGRRLGVSDEAARQRVHRATVKMRNYFARRGLNVSTMALGPVIVGNAVGPAPAALVAATAKAVSTGAGTVVVGTSAVKGVVAAIIASKVKAAVACAAAVVVAGGAAATVRHVVRTPHATAAVAMVQVVPVNDPRPEPTPMSKVIGYARTADGKPVAGAEVLVSTKYHRVRISHGSTWKGGEPVPPFLEEGVVEVSEHFILMGRDVAGAMAAGSVTGWRGSTSASGRFDLELNQPAAGVLVRSKVGIGFCTVEELADKREIILEPWTRVEGEVRLGSRVLPNTTIEVRNVSDLDRMSRANLMIEGAARSDANGHFLIPEAMPGKTWVLRSVFLSSKQVTRYGGETEFMSMTHPHVAARLVDLPAGGTAHVEVGGKGRPVVGRIVSPMGPFPFRRVTISPVPTGGEPPMRFAHAFDPAADGTFRAEDIPAGKYHLRIDVGTMSERTVHPTYAYLDYAASAESDFEIPAMSGGRSDEVFDLGEFKLTPRPHLAVGKPVADFAWKASDGSEHRLSEFRGKYVLLQLRGATSEKWEREGERLKAMFDRFAAGGRFAVVCVDSKSSAADVEKRPSGPLWINGVVAEFAKDVPGEYRNSGSPLYVIDPEGRLMGMNTDGLGAYAVLDKGIRGLASANRVVIDHVPAQSAEPNAPYTRVPAPTIENAAREASVRVVDGAQADNSGPVDRLVDGRMPVTDDAPAQNFKFQDNTLEGRVAFDLGRVVDVAGINSYSWHRDKRAPQVYRVYGSDGAGKGFEASPKNGTDPATRGWKLVADVDSREQQGRPGGRYAVGISSASGSLGRYRYLLFVMFPAQADDASGNTFYSEINVIERK